eukprot:gnl/TRDRNA2_/TRDRNA2_169454_c0_seq1.p1 gnl/TRDRNA2_/TRDRNA2_169454_c0~~gnl/TRDRNA2_/TRDRNA2_169454_c0_seq1.p1  ORF type:complete len:107 (+),score=8.48 gnl/TRDRNA2_/TRDRNA2_169454_c0_seq1:142-462(+)
MSRNIQEALSELKKECQQAASESRTTCTVQYSNYEGTREFLECLQHVCARDLRMTPEFKFDSGRRSCNWCFTVSWQDKLTRCTPVRGMYPSFAEQLAQQSLGSGHA